MSRSAGSSSTSSDSASSAAYFGFAFDEAAVRARHGRRGRADTDRPVKIRLRLTRVGAIEVSSARRSAAAPPNPSAWRSTTSPVDPADVFLFHKTTMRRRYEEARARHPDADDTLLSTPAAQMTETTVANVAVKLDGRWWTPPLDAGLLRRDRAGGAPRGRHAGGAGDRDRRGPDRGGFAVFSSVRGWRRAVLGGDRLD